VSFERRVHVRAIETADPKKNWCWFSRWPRDALPSHFRGATLPYLRRGLPPLRTGLRRPGRGDRLRRPARPGSAVKSIESARKGRFSFY
jgi:hypothetical protein